MKSMWLHGCFSLQIGSSRISRNGLWRRGDLSSQISGQVLLRPVLLQKIVDFGGGGGDGDSRRRSLDKAAKNPSCTAAVAATAFGQKNYSSSSFNSWNVDDHGSSSSWRRRRRRRRSKAFDSSPPPPPPNAPVQAEEEEGEEEEDLDHNNPEANGSSIGNNLPQQTVSSTGRWNSLPPRYKLVLTTSLAFVICNMDKVIFQKPKTPKRKKKKKSTLQLFSKYQVLHTKLLGFTFVWKAQYFDGSFLIVSVESKSPGD